MQIYNVWCKREQDSLNTDVKVIEKVKRECIIQNYANHGLNMIYAVYMQESMAISWIRKLSNKGNGSWRHIPKHYYSLLSPKLSVFNCNTTWKNLKGLNQYIPEVYRRILKIWVNVSGTNKKQTLSNSAQVIWNNNNIIYRNNCIFKPRWIKHSITFVSDIMTENGHISYNKVITKIQNTGITQFDSIV